MDIIKYKGPKNFRNIKKNGVWYMRHLLGIFDLFIIQWSGIPLNKARIYIICESKI